MRTGYMLQLRNAVFVDETIDLDHMLESVSDATANADNVTREEQLLVIKLIQEIKKDKERKYED